MTVYVTADWSRVVREDDSEAAFGVDESDIDSRFPSLRPQVEAMRNPPPPEPEPVPDEPEVKELPKPHDKAVRRPASK